MKTFNLFLISIVFQGCFPDFKSEEKDILFLKETEIKTTKIKWFFYSTVSTITPDYITIENQKEIDTICIANNIADLHFDHNRIKIDFYGAPTKYNEPIDLPKRIMNYEVVVDTSFTSEVPITRKFYKKDNKSSSEN